MADIHRKLGVRIGELLLFVSQRKKIGKNKYSETKYELTSEELEKIYDQLGDILNKKKL